MKYLILFLRIIVVLIALFLIILGCSAVFPSAFGVSDNIGYVIIIYGIALALSSLRLKIIIETEWYYLFSFSLIAGSVFFIIAYLMGAKSGMAISFPTDIFSTMLISSILMLPTLGGLLLLTLDKNKIKLKDAS